MVGAAVFGVIVFALMKAWRRLMWPRVRRQRNGWAKTTARVESSTRLTEKGDFVLVLGVLFPPRTEGYRSSPTHVRMRGIARLPEAVVAWMESSEELPVRVDPRATTRLVVDLAAIVGESADAFERVAYFEIGPREWRVVKDGVAA